MVGHQPSTMLGENTARNYTLDLAGNTGLGGTQSQAVLSCSAETWEEGPGAGHCTWFRLNVKIRQLVATESIWQVAFQLPRLAAPFWDTLGTSKEEPPWATSFPLWFFHYNLFLNVFLFLNKPYIPNTIGQIPSHLLTLLCVNSFNLHHHHIRQEAVIILMADREPEAQRG